MSFWSQLTGEDAADASRQAAADTYAKQQDAISKLLGYGNDYASRFADLSQTYNPYVSAGYAANDALRQLLADPNSVRALPGYQFDMGQGVQALDRSAAARGQLNSGRASKDLMRFATGLADKTYGDQVARLAGASAQGYGALGAQNQTIGQGLQGQLGAQTGAYGGRMNAAGTIGQGDIAAANAQAAGSQNLLNAGLKLSGMALGAYGGFPSMPGMGNWFTNNGGVSSYGVGGGGGK